MNPLPITDGRSAASLRARSEHQVIILTNDFPPQYGGIQRFMSSIANEMHGLNLNVKVIAPRSKQSRTFDRSLPYEIDRYVNKPLFIELIMLFISYGFAIWRKRPSYTLASVWFPTGFVAAFFPKRLRGTLGIFAHGSEIKPSSGGLRRLAMLWAYNRADAILANSTFTKQLLTTVEVRTHVDVVSCGTEPQSGSKLTNESPTLISTGRLIERKGFDVVIKALPELIHDFPTLRYDVIGDGPQRKMLEKSVHDLGLSDHVIFHGAVDDATLRSLLLQAWCFALPARTIAGDVEGFGIVYLEAAQCYLPSIAGINSGAIDIIIEGNTGYLVDGESISEVREAIRKMFSSKANTIEMGLQACRHANEHFSWRKTTQAVDWIMSNERVRS